MRSRLFRYLVSLVPALAGLFCAGGAHAAVGDYLYQWGAPYEFVNPQGIAAGPDGRIHVADSGISSFDASGNILARLRTPSGNPCRDVAGAPDGRIYGICRGSGTAMAIFEADGTYVKGFGAEGAGSGQYYDATSIAVSDSGEVYVGDAWNRRIQVSDRDGNYLRRWYSPGFPSAMAFDGDGNLFVADYYSSVVKKYSPTGTQLGFFYTAFQYMDRTSGLAIDREAREIYVMVSSLGGVAVYSLDDQAYDRQPVRTWPVTWSGGYDIAVDAAGDVYISQGDYYFPEYSVIQKYDRMGNHLAVWQPRGEAEGRFAYPTSAAIDASGDVLIADSGNRRVQRFSPEGVFAGAFALEPGCESFEIEQGDDGLVYLMERCMVGGASTTFVTSYTATGVPVSRLNIGGLGYARSFAVAAGKILVVRDGRIEAYAMDGTPAAMNWSLEGLRYAASPSQPYQQNPYWSDAYLRGVLDVELGSDGLIYVLNLGRHVVAFDTNGTALRWIPLGPQSGDAYRTIAVDACGDIFALWQGPALHPPPRVQAFDRNGVKLREWGSDGIEAGQFRVASGIAADGGGRVFVTDRDSHRVQVFEGLRACGQPVASAGADRTAHPGVAVTFDGSASTDPSGLPLSYSWRVVSAPAGSAAALTGADTAAPTLVPDLLGDYVVELVVSNAAAQVSQPDQVAVTTANAPPTVDAGVDQPVTLIGTTVALSGGSFDPDGDTITYSWSFLERPAGSAAVLAQPGSPATTFVADRNGGYLLSLTVADPWGGSATDTVLISFLNVPPVADAGRAQTVLQGTLVQLDGSACSDANGDNLTYSWELVQWPETSAAVLSAADAASPSFTADVPGTFVATLVVSDGVVESDAAFVTVTAVSYQDALTDSLTEMLRLVNSFPDSAFAGKNMRDTLGNKINAVIAKVEAGNYAGALNQMQNDLLPKMDGCALGEEEKTSDWITGCDEQGQIYPLALTIVEMMAHLNS